MKTRVLSGILALTILAGGASFLSSSAQAEATIKLCDKMSSSEIYQGENEDFQSMISGKDGWIYRSEFDLKQDEFALSPWSSSSFERLNKAFAYQGSKLAVAVIPTRGLVGHNHLLPPYKGKYDHQKAMDGYKGLLAQIRKAVPIVADTSDVDTVSGFFLKRDNHWTAEGARYMAQKVAEAVKADPVYADLKKMEFATEEISAPEGSMANDNFLEFIEETCGQKIEAEPITKFYATSPKDAADAQALLGHAQKPEVVLLGTSNSTEPEPSYANFNGFLKEALSVDVNNASVQGGSMRGAIGNYVLMGGYHAEKPKLIIWELSAHCGMDQKSMFREVIPALYGKCDYWSSMASTDGRLDGDETIVFDGLAKKKPMVSNAYYLALELEDKDAREITINFTHSNGKVDDMEISRSLRNFPKNNGLYFAELHDGIDVPLERVSLKVKDGKGKFTARMCRVPESR